jgi:hypothetical protein
MSAENPPVPQAEPERFSHVPEDVSEIEWDQVPLTPEVSPFDEAIELQQEKAAEDLKIYKEQQALATKEQATAQKESDEKAAKEILDKLHESHAAEKPSEKDPANHESNEGHEKEDHSKETHKEHTEDGKHDGHENHDAHKKHGKHDSHEHHSKPIGKKEMAIANAILGGAGLAGFALGELVIAPALVSWVGLGPVVSAALAGVGVGAAGFGIGCFFLLVFAAELAKATWEELKTNPPWKGLPGLSGGGGGGGKKKAASHAPAGGGHSGGH